MNQNDRRTMWRRHSTVESFEKPYQYSEATSMDSSPSNSPPLNRLPSYPYFDIFKAADASLHSRPRSSTVSEIAFPNPAKSAFRPKFKKYQGPLAGCRRLSFDTTTQTTSRPDQSNRRMSIRQSIFNRVVDSPRLYLSRQSIASVNTLFEGVDNFDDVKLNYEEVALKADDEVRLIWNAMLNHPNRESTRFDPVQLDDAVKSGVPKDMRSQVWKLLIEQHSLDRTKRVRLKEAPKYNYANFAKDLTPYQHAILIDLGRTFPYHPYFAHPLGTGQMSLFSMLKAYSLYDTEVGYCQGLSFVAGVLLLHMEEEQAFDVFVSLLYRFDLRKQYKPDMQALQIEMYQLSRLLSNKHKDLHEHFEKHEIPTLYAAPWFLTLFASAFPLGFVARVFDFVFLHGSLDVVFKIALVLLGDHKELIKQCNSFEGINDFLKLTLPTMSYIQMERIFNEVADIDISRDLFGFEVEYQVLQEEMFTFPNSPTVDINVLDTRTPVSAGAEAFIKMDTVNKTLKRQNVELLEKLTEAEKRIAEAESECKDLEIKYDSSMNTLNSFKCKLSNMEKCIETLELERHSLLTAIQKMKTSRGPLQNDSDMFVSCDIPNPTNNRLVRFYSNDQGNDRKPSEDKNHKNK